MNQNVIKQAAKLSVKRAFETMRNGKGGPFGAAIMKDGEIVCVESNTVLEDKDPTAHAEVNAIRQACKILNSYDLSGCVLYATGFPCPMCLSAIIWANIKEVYYGCDPVEAEAIGFRDDFIYRFIKNNDEHVLSIQQQHHDLCIELFKEYSDNAQVIY